MRIELMLVSTLWMLAVGRSFAIFPPLPIRSLAASTCASTATKTSSTACGAAPSLQSDFSSTWIPRGGNQNGGYSSYPYDDRGASYYPQDDDENYASYSLLTKNTNYTNRKIGLPLFGVGVALTLLGASLFFNATLIRLGHLAWSVGMVLSLGPGKTAGYMFQPQKARATISGCLGFLLVMMGWPLFGIILEVFGFLNLFGNMFPVAWALLQTIPGIGPLLRQSSSSSSRGRGGRSSQGSGGANGPYGYQQQQQGDQYYDQQNYYEDPDDSNQRYY
eukprot:Nitzschia sp. Nitz4//scaffold152_size53828//17730//18685//NITZ4_006738-RA/size53828-augustus-gene-0.96-mRNA-1//-1//CDS//3329537190//7147//frame0